MKAKFKWIISDGILVSVATDGELPDDLWKQLLNDIKTKQVRAYLQVVLGTLEMTSSQRKDGVDVANQKGVRIAVATKSSVVRGLVTAASWFGVDVKSFSLEEMEPALTFLGVSQAKMSEVLSAVARLKASVG